MLSAINKLGWLFLISTYPTFQKLETLPSITLFLLYRLYEENNPRSFFYLPVGLQLWANELLNWNNQIAEGITGNKS